MARINVAELFEKYGITEEQFKAYFSLMDASKKVYAAITHRKADDGILKILLEVLEDERIVDEIKNVQIPYQQTALIDGMPEPPDGECDKMYKIVFIDNNIRDTYSGSTYIYQGEKYAAFDNSKPRLYRTRGLAERSAKKLIKSCSNVTSEYEIVEA